MAIWLETLQFALSEAKDFFSKQKAREEKSYEAIEAIYEAANTTTIFLREGVGNADKPNKDLSEIWMAAATKVRSLDKELYFRLLGKAEYWSDPTIWTPQKINEANIALERIKADSKQILSDRSKKLANE